MLWGGFGFEVNPIVEITPVQVQAVPSLLAKPIGAVHNLHIASGEASR